MSKITTLQDFFKEIKNPAMDFQKLDTLDTLDTISISNKDIKIMLV